MVFQTTPSVAGVYRIKLLRHTPEWYLESVPYPKNNPSVHLAPLDTSSDKQKWNITPLGNDCYTISSVYDNGGLVQYKTSDTYWGYGYPLPEPKPSATWSIKARTVGNDHFSKITLAGYSDPFDSCAPNDPANTVHFYYDSQDAPNQRFVFELLPSPSPDPPPGPASTGKDFQSSFFTLTIEQAKTYEYDIIIIGTGIGGGILAGDLFDTNSQLGQNAKSILVIEKGDLVFHSHCLNTARPSGLNQDRGQQNDTFFAKFREDYTLSSSTDRKDWKGGPMFCLGGRSAAWGLFAPRIHDINLVKYFHPDVRRDLLTTYYREAETLMNLSLPTTKTIHQDLMERLNIKNDPEVQWQWGRIASEFREDRNFDFAKGAYSTIDKLLEIAMSKPIGRDGKEQEHMNFKMLLRTEVRRLEWDSVNPTQVTGVRVRTADGKEDTIKVKFGGEIVVCAGSVASAAILLRSGVDLRNNGGLHLTDHDIFFKAQPFQYRNPKAREEVGSMKLQTYSQVSTDQIILANMSIDASSFLPRGYVSYDDFPKWIIAFIRASNLNPQNNVELVNDEPVVTINREKPFAEDPDIKKLKSMTTDAMKTMQAVLDIDFIVDPQEPDDGPFFKALEMGGVAHELGTIPMRGVPTTKHGKPDPYCVDETLKLRGYKGVYVCDLSVFPFSPEVNPTLTLAALSLRLSRLLSPRLIIVTPGGNIISPGRGNLDKDTVYVVNHTGQAIKVWVGDRAKVYDPNGKKDVELQPGGYCALQRKQGTPEVVSVFKLKYKSSDEYLSEPEVFVAHPGEILPIL